MYNLFLVIIVIATEIVSNMSQKRWHWDDGQNWLAVVWLEVWGVVGSFGA